MEYVPRMGCDWTLEVPTKSCVTSRQRLLWAPRSLGLNLQTKEANPSLLCPCKGLGSSIKELCSFKAKALMGTSVIRSTKEANPRAASRRRLLWAPPSLGLPKKPTQVRSVLSRDDEAKNGGGRQQLPTLTPPISIPQLLHNAVSGDHSVGRVLCDAADSFITSFLTPLLPRDNASVDPDLNLKGPICAPVGETPPTRCRVVAGTVPPDLVGGLYIRNGPNAAAIHQGDGYHVFDGDGMLHAVTFKPGRDAIELTYCSRFVQTSRFLQEKEAKRPLMPKFFGGMVGVAGVARMAVTLLRLMLGLFDLRHGGGLSNANVCFFNGHILSLSDDDVPYIIRVSEDDGDLSTVGRFSLPSKYTMCAHPKFDPLTGDMYAFNLNLPFLLPPYSFFRLSNANGATSHDVRLPLHDMPLLHDFAMTPRYVIFPDHQLLIRPWKMICGESPIVCDFGKTSRFCVMSRHGTGNGDEVLDRTTPEVIWFDSPGINFLHVLNAWEEEEEIVMVAPVLWPPDRILELRNVSSILSEIRLNTKTREVKTRHVCRAAGGTDAIEFGVINPTYNGKKTKYAYLASVDFPHINGVIKVDLESRMNESAIVAERKFAIQCNNNGRRCYGSEPCFVPAKDGVAEDDGYLLCFVGEENSDASQLLIMDAGSPTLEIMAAMELPSRVPFGFHGCFITAEQLAQQT